MNSSNWIPSLSQKTLARTSLTVFYTLNLFPVFLRKSHLAPSDLHFFGPLKDALQGRRFADDDELKHSLSEEL